MKKSNYVIGFTLAIIGAFLFSAKAIYVKLVYRTEAIDAISMLALRMIFALPFYIITAWVLSRREGNVKLTLRQWGFIALLGFLGYYLSSLLDFMGLAYISAGLERLILFLYPTFALLIGVFAFKKKITKQQWLALVLAYIGMVVAFAGDIQHQTGGGIVMGSLLVLGCAVTYALYIVGGGEIIPKVGSMKFTAYALIFAAVGVFTQYLVTHGTEIRHFSGHTYWLCFQMAIVSTVLPTFMMSEGIRRIGSGNTAIITSIGPVSTILQAYIFLDEPVTWLQLAGTALVLAGVLMISKKNER
ncbi:EamA family transporter [Chitinophaga sp. SYP-B3965]|uniref:DMT family transporter n=1 Tax=Chitinophaga sp. SYP-B3965 TaxID=2663120 RepID=UPI0012995993|nr:DMT family transporter [Chitinophaga sp. SYP-B3965]MRG48727.1 EamA family transporter [Chitinophaga sp. SYP-B3965]